MSEQTHQRLSQQSSAAEQQRTTNRPQGPSNATQVDRMRAIQKLNTWLESQRSRVERVSIMLKQTESHGVLQTVENTWVHYEKFGYFLEMPTTPSRDLNQEPAGIFLPTELAVNLRPFIEMTESAASASAESSSAGVDWNTRLGIPEYRSQSDNLVAPEASCNVTTIAMILERMGIGREEVLAALESKMDISTLDSPESRDESWIDTTLNYLNRQMRAGAAYRRVRGEASLSNTNRKSMAEDYREEAQMEDLLDLLLNEMGIQRTSIISEPDRLLSALSGENEAPTSEQIWDKNWDRLAPQVQECLENGGGAAFSFNHKGNRSDATHIVSILVVENDGFLIDDPYGEIREDYNKRAWDDAYWSRNEEDKIIGSRDRSSQQNESGEVDDWGTEWARDLREEESRGQESRISSAQVSKSMFYVQLFHRGAPSESAPSTSKRPVMRGNPRIQ
jgi:hypothetical protein